MFARIAALFALFVIVNAAPIVDSSTYPGAGTIDMWTPIQLGPGPVKIQPMPNAPSKRDTRVTLPRFERRAVDLENLTTQISGALNILINDISAEGNTRVQTRRKKRNDVDDILDEIDSVLEENAEDFVRSYVQKGGQ